MSTETLRVKPDRSPERQSDSSMFTLWMMGK